MPIEWERRPVEIEGAARASYWQGKLHVYNDEGFRHLGPYTRDEGAIRVVVVGDSLTYGDGIAEEDTYSALVERAIRLKEPRLKIYNLGHDGAQSEDVLGIAKQWVPVLKPERVIYGICLNDFLPSWAGQYDNNMAWQIPLPDWIKKPFEEKSKTGALISDSYNRALMRLGIRSDFYADILKNFGDYQDRFGRDLAALNQFVLGETGHPAIAMVLDQYPASNQGYEISKIAETKAREAGMDVILTDHYYREYGVPDAPPLYVSKWEGHPNELANRIFASMIEEHVQTLLPTLAADR